MTLTRRQTVIISVAWLVSITAMAVFCALLTYTTDADRMDLIQRGAYASWDVNSGCLDSNEACAEALDRQNAELKPFGLEIMEDGSTIPVKLAEQNRKVENAGR